LHKAREPRFCNPMKNDGSNQARLFSSRLLLTSASGYARPALLSDGETDPCPEAVSIKTGVRGTLLGILLMHVVLIGVILACAAIVQS
jgi:hypothetical protein